MKQNIFFLAAVLSFVGAILLFSMSALAQATGAWNKSIVFSTPSKPNQSRKIYFYVPTNYDASQKYKILIALHGQGDDPASYISAFKPLITIFGGNLILISPNEGTYLSGFCDPPGEDDGILDVAVAEARKIYNIDTNYVYLSGLSQGGRAALKIGLDDYKKYRGLMLLTAACHSLNEAKNLTSFTYKYANGKYIPICNEVGQQDYQYMPIDTEVHNQLQAVGAKEQFTVIPNLGHINPSASQDPTKFYPACYNYIEGMVTNVDETDRESMNITVYPNPSAGELMISLHVKMEEFTHVETAIYNNMGEKAKGFTNNYMNGLTNVDLSVLPSGFYSVVVTTPHSTFSKKFILTK